MATETIPQIIDRLTELRKALALVTYAQWCETNAKQRAERG